ncbi:unnamed protein product [Paramecium primaurelia]|uniref:Peptidase M20 dimerisation domain-containing protein n=1 Tax=Paramecium primaurelia TaxID=5886 RepID=A0A8S1JP44_PARPR|nr:unnamed protein product [Paramecium primaurelia]
MQQDQMQTNKRLQFQEIVDKHFDDSLPLFMDILRVPSQSREFDPEYLTNGLLLQTAKLFQVLVENLKLKNAKIELFTDEGLSPFLFVEVEGSDGGADGTVLFYGHMDKQPPFTGWREGLSAYDPKIINDKLYARGGADDSYSVLGSVIAIRTIQDLGLKHPRVVMIFEADEESGSDHIEHYLNKLKDRIGNVDLIVCLDSGCGNYDQFWSTTTLRGLVGANVTVQVLNEGVHSGDASGVVPSSFRIFRQLLNRIDDPKTGEVVDDFQVTIPGERYIQAQKTAAVFSEGLINKFPLHGNTQPVSLDTFKTYINKVWKAQLAIVGADGLPTAQTAGNVLRPETTLKLSVRLPPTKDPKEAEESFVRILTTNVPYGATIKIEGLNSGAGFNALDNKPYLDQLINDASNIFYGKESVTFGEGGSIPLMNTLQQQFPKAQFIITGVLGPNSNEHGPNECLDLPYTKKLISCIAYIVSGAQEHLKK